MESQTPVYCLDERRKGGAQCGMDMEKTAATVTAGCTTLVMQEPKIFQPVENGLSGVEADRP